MQFADGLFKAYDIRGIAMKELTPALAEAIGRAFADWLPGDGPVAVGRDMRPDSATLSQAFINGLIRQGRDVYDIGLVTTDMIYFAVGKYRLAGGAMVTASHNPGQYNGIKLCDAEVHPVGLDSGGEALKRAIREDDYRVNDKAGLVTPKDVTSDWAKHVMSFVYTSRLKPYRIAVDAGNGMAGSVFPRLEPLLPFQVTRLFFDLDGSFPNHPANPMVPDNLKALAKVVCDDQLDFGLAFDGDGDRAFLVDETGEIVSGSIMTALLARKILADEPKAAIVYDLRMSHIVPDTIRELGGTPVRSKVGHPAIVSNMLNHKAPFGAEATGHFYFSRNYYADSAAAAALMAIEVLSQSGQKLSELVKPLKHYYSVNEINRPAHDMERITKLLTSKYTDGEQDWLDGLTITYPDWWFNLRPSNTEPTLRLNVEAKTPERLESETFELLNVLRS